MGTTIGVMMACLIVRYLMRVWRVSRVANLLGAMYLDPIPNRVEEL
jgi:hypothetical protein